MKVSLVETENTLRELKKQVAEKEGERSELQKELEQTEHLLQELQNRKAFLRSVKERRRTHRLIQYGAAMECRFRDLDALTDSEIYTMVQKISEVPGVSEIIRKAIEKHWEDEYSGSVSLLEESD